MVHRALALCDRSHDMGTELTLRCLSPALGLDPPWDPSCSNHAQHPTLARLFQVGTWVCPSEGFKPWGNVSPGCRAWEKPPKRFLSGNKCQALRCPFAVLSFLEKLFPPGDFGVAPLPLPAPTAGGKLQPCLLSQTPPPPLRKSRALRALRQRSGCAQPCIFLVSCSSARLNSWSSICWAGSTTCRPSPQILPCLLRQSWEGDHPQPARFRELLKHSPFLVRGSASPQPCSPLLSLLLHQRSFSHFRRWVLLGCWPSVTSQDAPWWGGKEAAIPVSRP